MPIKLVPTEFADLPQIARIENAAFGPSEHSKVLFPGGATNGALEERVERLQNEWKEDPTLTWWNAVDIESGEIVGAAWWHTYFTERPESEWMKEDISEDWGEGANPAACRAFFGDVHESRRRLIGGKPHICTFSYRCSPYPGLIASSTLHSCYPPGATEARSWVDVDQVGMRSCRRKESATYLEATPAGYPVYKKQGFADIDTFIFDFKPFTGRDGSVKFTNMTRPPKEA